MRNDQRRFPRIRVRLETAYCCGDAPDGQDGEPASHPGTILNTSRFGLGLQVDRPHQPLEQLWFKDLGIDDRPVTGVVQWVDGAPAGPYRIGIRLFHPAA